jgi:hypothetical protein
MHTLLSHFASIILEKNISCAQSFPLFFEIDKKGTKKAYPTTCKPPSKTNFISSDDLIWNLLPDKLT